MIPADASSRYSPTVPKRRNGALEPFLAVYLREMGSTPRLSAEREQQLARQLDEARAGLARLASRLSHRARRAIRRIPSLESPEDVPTLHDLELFVDALSEYTRTRNDPALSSLLSEARRFKASLDTAREELIVSNLRLVVHLAKRYLNGGLSFLDLIQEGNIGLMRAVEKFEYQRGHKFSTYAYWWIKQSIDRALLEKSRTIRLPFHLGEKQKKLFRARIELRRKLGRRPEPSELAAHAGLPLSKTVQLLELADDARSFDDLASEGAQDLTQCLADPRARPPLEQTVRREMQHRVEASLGALDSRARRVIRLRFGIGHDSAHTLREIGAIVNLSRERVRQILAAALVKLKATEALKDYNGPLALGSGNSRARARSGTALLHNRG